MAARNLLHKSKVDEFKTWLDGRGIQHRPGRGEYELLQVLRNDGQWFKLYRRESMPEHVTVQGPLVGLVSDFIADCHADDESATLGTCHMVTDAPPWEHA